MRETWMPMREDDDNDKGLKAGLIKPDGKNMSVKSKS